MTRHEFLNVVVKIYFRDNCETTKEALETAEKELNISRKQFIDWFGKGCSKGVN